MPGDDEAFIRAVVAAPGDDAPRLVYADWLDERGDPRAAYLRLLVECADRLADPGLRERTDRRLRQAARSLNSVWVARVSPPPIGVCSRSVRFLDPGSELTGARLDQLEGRLKVRLPPDYRAFLLNHNGGIPDPRFGYTGHSQYDKFELHSFHAVGEWMTDATGVRTDAAFERHVEKYWLRTTSRMVVPIAAYTRAGWHGSSSAETDEVLIGVRENQLGKVYLGHEWMRFDRFEQPAASATFADFLALFVDVPDDWVPDWD